MLCRTLSLTVWVTILGHLYGLQLSDLIQGDPQKLLHTLQDLSDDVSSQYQEEAFFNDAAPPPAYKFEKPEYSLRDLNKVYSNLLIEGDMLMSEDKIRRYFTSRGKRQALIQDYPDTIWQNGVPFVLDSSLSSAARNGVLNAIHFWYKETCINFIPRTNERHYLTFIGNDYGCWSTVGKDGYEGKQVVSIGAGCEHFGITTHEIGHALGVYHTQSRYDRDSYVRFNPRVIPRNMLHNFAKLSSRIITTYGLPYETSSVMHYRQTEFSNNPSVPSLTAVNPNYQQGMGQMKEPTFLDVAILNKHYRCEQKCRYLVDCLNGGYTNPRTCTTCKCPSGFSGTYCERIEPSYSRHCGGEITVDGTTRRFEMSVTQNSVTSDKKCIYHLKAPQGRRISINLLKVNGRCLEGCWQDGVEFKMTADYRLTGFRFCCPETTRRNFVSETNLVPLIVYTSRRRIEVAFEYSIENQRFFDLESGNPNVIDSDNEHIFNNVVYHGNSRDGIIAAISD